MRTAHEEAVRLLSRRDLSAEKLRAKLEAQFSEEDVSRAMESIRPFLGDHRLQARIVEQANREGRSDAWVIAKLEQFQVKPALEGLAPEVERALLVAGKHPAPFPKTARRLAQQGFCPDTIEQIAENRTHD